MNEAAYLRAAEELRANDDQWKVYESDGNCVVQAGPGGGKTKTITIKIARLLNETVRKPRRVACITYSNACVGELRTRLRKLGVGDDDRLRLATVHSFCLTELVLPYARLVASASQTPWWWPRHPGHGRFFARRIWKQLAALRRTGSA